MTPQSEGRTWHRDPLPDVSAERGRARVEGANEERDRVLRILRRMSDAPMSVFERPARDVLEDAIAMVEPERDEHLTTGSEGSGT